jgi:uncharacterized protein
MQARKIHQGDDGQRTFVIVLDTDDEVLESLKRFVEREKLGFGQFSAIGAFGSARLGYFDWERKDYNPIAVSEQAEVASLIGDLATGPDGKPSLHIHCVLGCRDGRAVAGHLLEARVRPILEIVWRDSPAHLRKRRDADSGLALIDLKAAEP